MTSVVKNRIMRILAAIAIVCVGMVFTFSLNTAKAQNIAEEGFAVRAEAGVNISDNLAEEGIAFYTDVDTTIYQGEYEVYTLITAEKYLVDGDITSLTKESSGDMDACRVLAITSDIHGVGDVVTYMATITYDQLEEANLSSAYATKLVARSYMVTAEGEVIYAKNNNKAVSMQEVAKIHLAEALESEDAVTEEAFEKFIKYAGIKDVKAYYENATEVQFIDQDLNGAVVYALEVDEETGKKDVVANLGTIQNGKLSNLELAMVGAGEKTQLIISNGEQAIVTNATEATQIIDSTDEFIALFGKQFNDANHILDTLEAYLNTDGAEWKNVFSTRTSGTYNGKQTINTGATVLRQTLDGYYVLGTDLDMSGVTYSPYIGVSMGAINEWLTANPTSKINALITAGTVDFTGNGTQGYYAPNNRTLALGATFDGLGHSIYNLHYSRGYGIFGRVEGAIKNLGIVNATYGNEGNTTVLGLSTGTKAKIENVYVKITSVGTNTSLLGNRQAGLFQKADYGHYKNVVIEYPDVNASFAGEYGTGYFDYMGYSSTADQNVNTSTENVIAITKTKALGAYTNKSTTTSGRRILLANNDANVTEINGVDLYGGSFSSIAVVTGVNRYDDYDALKAANVDLSAFDNGLWDISTGVPIWANVIESSVVVMPTELVFEASNEITSQAISISSDLVDLDVEYSVADTSVVTFEDGIVTVVDPYIGGNTVINYSYVIAGKTITGSIPVRVAKMLPNIGGFDVSAKDDVIPAEIANKVDSTIVGIYLESDLETNILTGYDFVNETGAVVEIDVLVKTESGREYRATLNVYTDILTTSAEFADTAWRMAGGTYALGNDIDMHNVTIAGIGATTADYADAKAYYFDGKGHVVSGIKTPYRGLFGQNYVLEGSIFKNFALTDVTIGGESGYAILAWAMYKSTVQDVYVQVTNTTNTRSGALCVMVDGLRMTNVVVEYPEINPNGNAPLVGEDAKLVNNWAGNKTNGGIKGYPFENIYNAAGELERTDQGGGILESNYYSYHTGNYVGKDRFMSTTQSEMLKANNVIAISKTAVLMSRFGQGAFVYGENEYSKYISGLDESGNPIWKTDSAGTSYGDYFTLRTYKDDAGTLHENAKLSYGGIRFMKGAFRYDDYASLRQAELDLTAFDNGMWDISTGAPIFKGFISALDGTTISEKQAIDSVQISVNGNTEAEAIVISAEETTATFNVTSAIANVTFTGNIADTTIATYSNGVITKVVNGGSTVFDYTYTVAGKTFTGSLPVVIEKAYAKLGTIIVDNDTTALTDLSVDGNIVSIKDFIDGTEYYVDNDITLTNDTNDVISVVVIVTTDTGAEYKATIEVYKKIIKDFDEFNSIFGLQNVYIEVTHKITEDATGNVVWEKTYNSLVDRDNLVYVNNGSRLQFNLDWTYDGVHYGDKVPLGFTRAADKVVYGRLNVSGTYILADNIDFTEKTWDPQGRVYDAGADTIKLVKGGVQAYKGSSLTTTVDPETGVTYQTYTTSNMYGATYYDTTLKGGFEGTFNGNGYSISNAIFTQRGGLFGVLDGGTIKNLAVRNATIKGGTSYASALASSVINNETVIDNVFVEVTSWDASTKRYGALLGYIGNTQGTQPIVSGWTLKNTVVIAPDEQGTSGFSNGVFWSHPGNVSNVPNAENVLAISTTPWLGRHASNRVTVAENSDLTAKTTVKVTGVFHYADIATAMSAGYTKVGNWVITAEGVSWQDSVQTTYTISKKA